MKKSELNEMNQAELENKLQDNLDALQNLRFQKSLQQLENPLGIKVLRRENSQIKTVLREFDLGLRTKRSEK
ncbi:MAG: 50S ribosomal protein L29 [Candidatus Marinimicrobia bacterium]|nr:50S ribosomal protein L29 [Candidatus Neomarinimicrobiota bacterium]